MPSTPIIALPDRSGASPGLLPALALAVALLVAGAAGCGTLVVRTGEGQPAPTGDGGSPGPAARPLILTNLVDPPLVRRQYGKLGVRKAWILYGWHFDPDATGTWARPDRTREWLRDIPLEFDGFICLDWEGAAMEAIAGGREHPKHAHFMKEMGRLLSYVKQRRPRAKVGFYGLPAREYWNQDDDWRSAMLEARELLDQCDVLYPSVYDFYAIKPERDRERYGKIVELALELAGERPVILYTWHRYHNSTEQFGFQLIPEDEYVSHIRHLLSVEVDGRRPAGVIAWGADEYYHRQTRDRNPDGTFRNTGPKFERMRAAFAREMKPGETIEDYMARLNVTVYRRLGKATDPAKLE